MSPVYQNLLFLLKRLQINVPLRTTLTTRYTSDLVMSRITEHTSFTRLLTDKEDKVICFTGLRHTKENGLFLSLC